MTLGDGFDGVMVAARGGEEWALRAVYEELVPPVRGYLRAQGETEPDELVGETFMRMVRDLATFDGDEPALRSWVLTIAHRRLLEERDANREEASLGGGSPETPEEHRVSTMLARLSSDQRTVVLLRAVGGLTVEQVADALGKPPDEVKHLQRQGLGALAPDGEARISTGPESGRAPETLQWDAPELPAETARELTRLMSSLVDHARRLQRESEGMVRALEAAIAIVRPPAGPAPGMRSRPGQQTREGLEATQSEVESEALLRAAQLAIGGSGRAEMEAALTNELRIPNAAEIVDQILGSAGS